MSTLDPLTQFNRVHISNIHSGVFLVNLGQVLEIEEHSDAYSLVIRRMNEKQVVKFDKDASLVLEQVPQMPPLPDDKQLNQYWH